MFSDACMPPLCWIAPEMPAARYSFGATVLPVWPIWAAYGYQPASTTARVAATALLPPNAPASSSSCWKPSALPRPRPPATRMSAPSMSTSAPRCSPRWTILAFVDHGENSTFTVSTVAEPRSEEHTSELQSRQYLPSSPTRRSSDLRRCCRQTRPPAPRAAGSPRPCPGRGRRRRGCRRPRCPRRRRAARRAGPSWPSSTTARTRRSPSRPWPSRDRKSTRLNSSHANIYPLPLHDALPIYGAVAAKRARQLLELLEALGLAQAAAAGDEDVGALDVHVGAALLAALDHLGLRRPRRELDVHRLDRGRAEIGRAHV